MIQAPVTAAALTGIRVLDLTTNYAAYAGRLLADLGADVVRVEPPGGSPVRSLAPSQPGPMGEVLSFAHAFLDAGKRSVTLDLMTAAGRQLLAELAASCDAMLRMMRAQLAGSRRLNHFITIPVAHKTGDFAPVLANDVGIIYGRSGPIVVTFLGNAITGNYGEAEDRIGRFGQQLVELLDK